MPRRHPNLTPALRGEAVAAYIACRTLRHAWDPIPTDFVPAFGDAVMLRCMRCGTVRIDVFSRLSGERISPPRYDHPDGYRDAEKHPMSWWRATWAENLGVLVVGEHHPKAKVTPITRGRRKRSATSKGTKP